MIAWLVLVLLALAIGGAVAALLLDDPGYVLIAYADATLETSLWFAAGALLALWVALAGGFFLLRGLLRSGVGAKAWFASRRRHAAHQHSLRGAMLLAEGRWREARKALLAPPAARTPLLDYFGAAQAANELDDHEQRDGALERAKEAIPEASFVVELRRAELQQAAAQWQESVTTLAALRRLAPRHPVVNALLFKAYQTLGDWDAVAELAPSVPEKMPIAAQIAMWRVRLGNPDGVDAVDHAHQVWAEMPKRLRDEESLLLAYVDVLAGRDAAAAEAALRSGLKRTWNSAWIRRYGEIHADAQSQLKTATSWLKHHPNDPTLLFTLGRLAAAAGEPQQAKAHLRASIEAEPSAATLAELGNLCVADGESAAANDYFQRAMMLIEQPLEAEP